MKVGIIISIAIAIAVLVIALVPLTEVAYTVTVDYEATETYYEREPYQATETYYETQPLTYEVVKSYIDTGSYKTRRQLIIGGIVFQDEIVEISYPIGSVTLRNTDTVSGTFTVQFTFYALRDKDFWRDPFGRAPSEAFIKMMGRRYSGFETLHLEPSETRTVRKDYDIRTYPVYEIDIHRDAWFWEYEVTPDTKEVERERTVTRYRDVERERTVIRQRQETRYKRVTLLDYLLHY
jgi:hypothetical protein